MEKVYYCPKCGGQVSRDPEHISPDYFAVCLDCDEDFYKIELHETPPDLDIFKCRACGLKKPGSYCCEHDQGLCLDCCADDCADSLEARAVDVIPADPFGLCECSIPKTPDGPEQCDNRAEYYVELTEEYDNDNCLWCAECCALGADMIKNKTPINPDRGALVQIVQEIVAELTDHWDDCDPEDLYKIHKLICEPDG